MSVCWKRRRDKKNLMMTFRITCFLVVYYYVIHHICIVSSHWNKLVYLEVISNVTLVSYVLAQRNIRHDFNNLKSRLGRIKGTFTCLTNPFSWYRLSVCWALRFRGSKRRKWFRQRTDRVFFNFSHFITIRLYFEVAISLYE